ncbi:carboxypeptidase-like regulatory domain-containing protein [Hymenobacter siberiensis]|jgi:hypothetical protein|uniref:carboxypeptidase-like regulatory domain-containing protein n=1 Tax=Hymenobacter siberiensis TaxID=2848396 RepID=UPI001C1E0756|nr:carboxypeptidase-like regulatory domain-containing protein [Hymenobacter siberiensis]MBU6122558.1 carboxypeptidase-like regulatory domain-containing protein [Hymenobacter siberiensis]
MRYFSVAIKLALLLTATTVRAQQPAAAKPSPQADELECRVLTGRVTDPFAYPLTGATIMLRHPGQGLSPDAFSTNAEGHYIITSKQAIARNTVMEINALGYSTLELPLTNCQPLDITLTPLASPYAKPKGRNKKLTGNGKVR